MLDSVRLQARLWSDSSYVWNDNWQRKQEDRGEEIEE